MTVIEIKTDELRRVLNMLIDHLEDVGVQTVEVEQEFYWHIPDEKLYDLTQKPDNVDTGQLSCDWERLQEMARNEKLIVSYGLAWVAPILRYIGEKIGG